LVWRDKIDMRVKIRPVDPKDFKSIWLIERLSFKTPYSRSLLRYLMQCSHVFLVAELEGKVVGYVCGVIERREQVLGHIFSIAVHPEYRRMRIGTALMIEAINMLKRRGAQKIYLECRVSNIAAIKLYEKLGFRVTKRIKSYYRDGEDAYIMELEL